MQQQQDDGDNYGMNNVTLRPQRLAAELATRKVAGGAVAVLIPYRSSGYRISVEFDGDLFDTYNDGTSCCNLTDAPGVGHSFVHRQPRNSMLIFAEPMLTTSELPALDPEHDPALDPATDIAYAPLGDVRGFINRTCLPNATAKVYDVRFYLVSC